MRACLVRPKYAARLLADGVKAAEVVALGGFRSLGGDEVELADNFGIATDNELHAMVEGVQRGIRARRAAGVRQRDCGQREHGLADRVVRRRARRVGDSRTVRGSPAPREQR